MFWKKNKSRTKPGSFLQVCSRYVENKKVILFLDLKCEDTTSRAAHLRDLWRLIMEKKIKKMYCGPKTFICTISKSTGGHTETKELKIYSRVRCVRITDYDFYCIRTSWGFKGNQTNLENYKITLQVNILASAILNVTHTYMCASFFPNM